MELEHIVSLKLSMLRAADDVPVNLSDIKTLLANGLSTFSINGKPGLNNSSRGLQRNPPDCVILHS